MRLITPFEFIERHPEGQRVILVGNGPSLKGESLGSWIDSHDIVIRYNACPLEGYAEDVGTRTDILISNPYPDAPVVRPPLMSTQRPGTVLILSPQTRRGDISVFAEWADGCDVFFTYTPALMGVSDSDHTHALTTGTYSAHLLPRLLKPSHLSCTGFTLFLSGKGHYWNDALPSGLHAHDIEREAKIFIRILNRCGCPLEVTREIAWVAKHGGVELPPHTILRPLKKPDWNIY